MQYTLSGRYFRLIKYSAQADDNSAHEAATWQHHRQDLPSDPKAWLID